jgi:hypothetical protein
MGLPSLLLPFTNHEIGEAAVEAMLSRFERSATYPRQDHNRRTTPSPGREYPGAARPYDAKNQ